MINYSRIKQRMLRNFNRPRIGLRDETEGGVDRNFALRRLSSGWVAALRSREGVWVAESLVAQPLRSPPFFKHPDRQTVLNKRTKRIQEYRRRFSRR